MTTLTSACFACAVILTVPVNSFTFKLYEATMKQTAPSSKRWRVMEGEMKTVENGRNHLICFVLIFFPSVQARAVAGSWRPMRKSGADGRVTHTVSEPSLCKTGSLNPSLLALQHSPACCAALCSFTIDEKDLDQNSASSPFEWVFSESYLKSFWPRFSWIQRCHSCQTKVIWVLVPSLHWVLQDKFYMFLR